MRTLIKTLITIAFVSQTGFQAVAKKLPTQEISDRVDNLGTTTPLILNDGLVTGLTPSSGWMKSYVFNQSKASVKLTFNEFGSTCIPANTEITIVAQISWYGLKNGVYQSSQENVTFFLKKTSQKGQSYEAKDIYLIPDAHYIKAEITSISNSTVASYFRLGIELQQDRTIELSSNELNPTYNIELIDEVTLDATTNEWWVKLDPSSTACGEIDEVDLEWVFIDKEDVNGVVNSTITYSFINGCSRVTISGTEYRLANVFEQGYILFRARKVSYIGGRRITGAWSSTYTNSSGSLNADVGTIPISSTSKCLVLVDDENCHAPQLSWQYQLSFAEDAKRSDQIQYFDGLNRSRQMVFSNYADNSVLVKEVIFDFSGRPAIEVAPTPVKPGILKFYSNFNQNTSGNPYSAHDFDLNQTNVCVSSTGSMKPDNDGASNYYSTYNKFNSENLTGSLPVPNIHDFVPVANGFPFIQTIYTQDGTGRVHSKGQMGSDFLATESHATTYFYTKPEQRELDEWFGEDIGYDEMYKKVIVKDPNGQYSFSVQDLQGRTIATGLSGASRYSEGTITGYQGATTKESILQDDHNPAQEIDGAFVVKDQIVLKVASDFSFYYSLNPARYLYKSCLEVEDSICNDCIYDLEISLVNRCGEEQMPGSKLIRTISYSGSNMATQGDQHIYSFSSDATLSAGSSGFYTISNLPAGEYTLIKTLRINQTSLEEFAKQYLENKLCVTLEEIESEELGKMDFTACELTCEECDSNLSHYLNAEVYADSMEAGRPEGTVTDEMRYQWKQSYNEYRKTCDKICGRATECDAYLEILYTDITPGGQYAKYGPSETDPDQLVAIEIGSGKVNLLDIEHSDKVSYKTVFDNSTSITINGTSKLVKNLTVNEFIANWDKYKADWQAVLVQYHPEYCEYLRCSLTRQNGVIEEMMSISTYDEAKTKGFIVEPTSGLPGEIRIHYPNAVNGNTKPDPFMAGLYSSNLTLHGTFTSKLSSFITYGTHTYSIWDIPVLELFCNTNEEADYGDCLSSNRSYILSCEPYKNYYWKTIRSMYYSERQKFVEENKAAFNTILSCSTSIPSGYEKRILSVSKATEDYGSKTAEDARDELEANCTSVCTSYVTAWNEELSKCPELSPLFVESPSTESMLEAAKADILDEMVKICKKGCDEKHPMGSSNVSPENYDQGEYNSFEELFATYVFNDEITQTAYPLAIYEPKLCESFNITMPKSYDHDYLAKDDPKTKKCACNPELAASDPNCPCNDVTGHEISSEMRDLLIMMRTDVPDSLRCENCIDCAIFKKYLDDFYDKYNGEFDEHDPNDQLLLTHYMNNRLGFNLNFHEYSTQASNCLGKTATHPLREFSGWNDYSYSATYTLSLYNPTLIGSTNQGGLPYPSASVSCTDFKQSVSTFMQDRSEFLTYWVDSPNTLEVAPNIYQWLHHYEGSSMETELIGHFETTLSTTYSGLEDADLVQQFHACYPMPVDLFSSIWNLSGAGNIIALSFSEIGDSANSAQVSSAASVFNNYLNSLSSTDPVWGSSYTHAAIGLLAKYAYSPAITPEIIRDYSILYSGHLCSQSIEGYAYADMKSYVPYLIKGVVTSVPSGILNLKPTNFLNELVSGSHNLNVIDNMNLTEEIPMALTFIPFKFPHPNAVKYEINHVDFRGIALGNSQFGFDLVSKDNPTIHVVIEGIDYSINQGYVNINSSTSISFDQITEFRFVEMIEAAGFDHFSMIFLAKINMDWQFMRVTFSSFAFSGDIDLAGCFPSNSKLCNRPMSTVTVQAESPCERELKRIAKTNALNIYNAMLREKHNEFVAAYLARCRSALKEVMKKRYDDDQYQITLYYYDQAGNLVKTVPPKGVTPLSYSTVSSALTTFRAIPLSTYYSSSTNYAVTSHTFVSSYTYNTLNQLKGQTTPDAGSTEFWYDAVGRLVLSQNAKQSPDDKYSYTLYDGLGRISQVGEVSELSGSINFNQSTIKMDLVEWLNLNSTSGGAPVQRQVTTTVYDEAVTAIFNGGANPMDNLRGRVAHILVKQDYDPANPYQYDYAASYSYDIQGNVSMLYRHTVDLEAIGNQGIKVIRYEYDQVSGKVNRVWYQPDENDQYIYDYVYDASNRLTAVYTGSHLFRMQKEASYQYYLHGPLARTEYGELKVQGQDYIYTVNGWLKGSNSASLTSDRDPGLDGSGASSNTNAEFLRDEYGFSLDYYRGDYTPSNATSQVTSVFPTMPLNSGQEVIGGMTNTNGDLFNGNIKRMTTGIAKFMENDISPVATQYDYDQLNRLIKVKYFDNMNHTTNTWQANYDNSTNPYLNTFTYDQNGNIQTQLRNGFKGLNTMDNLTYEYSSSNNKLVKVTDSYGAHTQLDDDLDGEINYTYDEIGNLISDPSAQIEEIKWNVYGKIEEINRSSSSTKPDIKFGYSPDGYRVYKAVYPKSGTVILNVTYYIRDAQGNILATYNRKMESFTESSYSFLADSITLAEQMLYGSSLVGVNNRKVYCGRAVSNITGPSYYALELPESINGEIQIKDRRGARAYQLCNHLGNVMVVLSDKRECAEGVIMSNLFEKSSAEGWRSDVAALSVDDGKLEATLGSYQDIYKNILTVPGRSYSMILNLGSDATNLYAVVYGVEDDEAETNIGIQALGSGSTYTVQFTAFSCNTHLQIFNNTTTSTDLELTSVYVTEVASNAQFKADVLSATDYSAFGAPLPGRTWSLENYRFGFNGMEKDNEAKGGGNSYDFGARIYDPKLGKWLSKDPLQALYADFTPYCFALNTPINGKDVDGRLVILINGQHAGSGGSRAYWNGVDQGIMTKLGDYKAMYFDGALGGWRNTILNVFSQWNVRAATRYGQGFAMGRQTAEMVFSNLKPGESIKLVSHSMGEVFKNGYVQALKAYYEKHKAELVASGIVFDIEDDIMLQSFQGSSTAGNPKIKATNQIAITGYYDLVANNRILSKSQVNGVPNVTVWAGHSSSNSRTNQILVDWIPKSMKNDNSYSRGADPIYEQTPQANPNSTSEPVQDIDIPEIENGACYINN